MKNQPSIRTLRAEDFDQEKDLLLVDVRTPVEFREKHIPGSHLHPLHELDVEQVKEKCQSGKVCLICQSGSRSQKAVEQLSSSGMEIFLLDGGIASWEQAGRTLNRGSKSMSLERQVRIAAGILILIGVLGSLVIHSGFLALAGFVGAGLVFAGATDWCGMGLLLARMPWNQDKKSCCAPTG